MSGVAARPAALTGGAAAALQADCWWSAANLCVFSARGLVARNPRVRSVQQPRLRRPRAAPFVWLRPLLRVSCVSFAPTPSFAPTRPRIALLFKLKHATNREQRAHATAPHREEKERRTTNTFPLACLADQRTNGGGQRRPGLADAGKPSPQ